MPRYSWTLIAFLSSIISLFSYHPLSAQTLTFKGKVFDKQKQVPVEWANVAAWGKDSLLLGGTTTNEEGSFTLSGIRQGQVVLKVQFIGYQTTTLIPTLATGTSEVQVGMVLLSSSEVALEEVVVQGERATTVTQLDKQVISAKSFQNAANGTGLDLLQRLPSFTVNTEGGLLLRGSENFTVLINGKPTNRSPADVLAQLPANTIENIEIITSPSAKYDADGKAGLVNIITTQDLARGWSLTGNGMVAGADPQRYGGDILVHYTAPVSPFTGVGITGGMTLMVTG